jgi:CDP-diacylglycerol--serine O-phosphatidyltransferase
MPIPAAAGLLAATIHLCYGYPNEAWWIALIWLAIVGTSGFLMVSTWRFWSGKEISFSRSHPFQILLLVSIVLFLIFRFSQVALFSMTLIYMFSGIWARAAYSWSRRRRRRPDSDSSAELEETPVEPNPLSH